jgi:hypothetical protein
MLTSLPFAIRRRDPQQPASCSVGTRFRSTHLLKCIGFQAWVRVEDHLKTWHGAAVPADLRAIRRSTLPVLRRVCVSLHAREETVLITFTTENKASRFSSLPAQPLSVSRMRT